MIKGQEMREREGLSHQACVYAGSVNTHTGTLRKLGKER